MFCMAFPGLTLTEVMGLTLRERNIFIETFNKHQQ